MGGRVGMLRRPEKSSLVRSRVLAEKEGAGPGFPSLLYGHRPTTHRLPSLGLASLFYEKGREMVFLGMHAWGSIQNSAQERCKSGHRVPVAQSQSAATSVPRLFPASEWAQALGM